MRAFSRDIYIEDEDSIPDELIAALIDPNKCIQVKTSIGYIDVDYNKFSCGVTYCIVTLP